LAAKHCPPQRRKYHCALYDALASALILRALCAVEGRSAATLAQLAKDSLSAPAADELSQGELEL
jgi:DNA polymerase-3 subunit epsilon